MPLNRALSSYHSILVSRLRDTLNIRRLMHPNNLCRAIYGFRPRSSSLDELFNLRSQFRICKAEIINSTGPQNRQAWKTSATTIHESTACLAEVIGHGRVGANGLFLTKGWEIVLTTDVLEICVVYCNIGLVEGWADLATVDAMADMAIEQTGLFQWLFIIMLGPWSFRFSLYHSGRLTSTSCTAPQKQVAVASSSVDQPSLERWTTGKPWSSKEVIFETERRKRTWTRRDCWG